MPRPPRTIQGPSRLSGILAHLTRQPRLELSSELTKLKVSYKFKNGDYGARYFVKEELPRIRFANPTLQIQVNKLNPSLHKSKQPSMVLEFANAPRKTVPLSSKWSTEIVTDLMSTAGSTHIWPQWVQERTSRGESVYVDRYGNGSGREGYVRKERVWKVSTKPRGRWVAKGKQETVKEKLEVGEKEAEGRDGVKELLGLDTTPIETGPPKAGVAAALP